MDDGTSVERKMPALGAADGAEKSGYLRKLSSKGKWQKRWFETSASSFVYRKDHEAESVLASISVSDISDISLHGEDGGAASPPLCHFTIQIGVRSYEFKAPEEVEARAWVVLLQERRAQVKATTDDGGTRMSRSAAGGATPPAAPAAGSGDPDVVAPKESCCCTVQ